MSSPLMRVRVHSIISDVAGNDDGAVKVIDLRPVDDTNLPRFQPGAHIDLYVSPGLTRQYSLVNDADETHRYVIAVLRDEKSRGGSVWLHDWLEAGDHLTISKPRCHFALFEEAAHSVFIAGGIGVTPLWCMAQRQLRLGRSFQFHYGARSRDRAPLIGVLAEKLGGSGCLQLSYDNPTGGGGLDLKSIVRSAPGNSHFYACGPAGMLDAFIGATAEIPSGQVHLERFGAVASAAVDGGFDVELARSGRTVAVPAGQTILQALKAAGINASHSCAEGICGACEVAVLSGVADHRDAVLTDGEKAAGKTMMICCSGAKTPRLVLDL
jgi:tetrachlorobenzoquinone reductase